MILLYVLNSKSWDEIMGLIPLYRIDHLFVFQI